MREDILKKRDDESREQYIYRCYSNKVSLNLRNEDLAEAINKELGTSYQESYIRGIYKNYAIGYDDGFEKALCDKKGSNKLDEIKEELGELYIVKQEVKNKMNKLGRIKRDFVKAIEISNDIKEALREEIDEFREIPYEPIIRDSENKLIVLLSDWHIGYVIKDYKGNRFNYNIAKERLSKLLAETKKMCNLYNITDVVVVNGGDSIEGLYMRQNQSYECEFNLNEQIVKATRLLYGFCTSISEYANVEFVSVGGNHNRGAGSKDANIEGDNSNIIIVEMFKDFVELSKNNRIHVLATDFKDDSAVFEMCGKKIKVIHGDNRVKESKKLFDAEATMDKDFYDIILRGHFHNFNIETMNNGGYVITNGCLFGANPYSAKRMSCYGKAGQTLIVVNEDGVESIKNVELN